MDSEHTDTKFLNICEYNDPKALDKSEHTDTKILDMCDILDILQIRIRQNDFYARF